ncbi:MAG: DNA polymerase Y family protein [Gemmatimonadota bacterium]|nr:DNA polymerase Y family protein [Gemmatimonadota bacterium]
MAKSLASAQGVPTHHDRGWAQNSPNDWLPTTTADIGWVTDSKPASYSDAVSSRRSTGSRRALCLWLPTFELRLELVRSPELDSTSVALLSPGESARRTIWQVSERAHASGVRPGQLVSQAVSLCTSLTLLEPDPAHYDAAVDTMLEVLTELTPIVEPAGRGRVFLGMDGLERLFGSPRHQIDRALRSLFRVFPSPLVAATRAGLAPGKFGAWVAAASARSGSPIIIPEERLGNFFARCPVRALPVDPLVISRLERLGIHTLGELRRFPEPALVAQFGEDGKNALAWSTARRIDPVRPWHRPRPIRVSLEFPNPVGMVGTLHGALDRLVERALSRPARRGRSVTGVRMGAHLEGGGSWFVETVLREPTSDRERIVAPLRAKMELSPPSKAVETLLLELTDFGVASTQTGLFDRKNESGRATSELDFDQGEVPANLRDAVKELKLRLGHSPLYRVVEVDPWSRIPERRHALLSFDP